MKKESILVVGCQGYLGTHLVNFLRNNEFEVYGLDLMNLNEEEHLLEKCEVIIFSNGLSNHEIGKSDPLFDFQKNVQDYTNLMSNVAFKDKKLIYLGSLCQYGLMRGTVLEEYPMLPIEPQGLNKRYIESMICYLATVKNFRYVSLRLGAVIGKKKNLKNLSFFEKVVLGSLSEKGMEIWGGMDRSYSYIWIHDFLNIVKKILILDLFDNNNYNCSDKNIKFSEIIEELEEVRVLDKNIQEPFKINSEKLFSKLDYSIEDRASSLDISRIKEELTLLSEES
ncbi:MAG: NAD(P)-dependent oxidoreductase [Candidatus Cloacimonetes bacterium]|nr:NAD(P)-dependent oxidoreductase [Candidatus Cloacimonadota bacterium]